MRKLIVVLLVLLIVGLIIKFTIDRNSDAKRLAIIDTPGQARGTLPFWLVDGPERVPGNPGTHQEMEG
jgi:hypothetical protein